MEMIPYILIPAHNEEQSIAAVIKDLRAHGYNFILVVNDGSVDKTEQIVRELGVEVLSCSKRQGQGAALQAGLDYLNEHKKPDIIITFDADGQHRAVSISDLVAPIMVSGIDISLGSRFLSSRKNELPFSKKIMLQCATAFTRAITGLPVTDTHNGLRALSQKAYSIIRFQHSGMAHASEIFDFIKKHSLTWAEVPVIIEYSEYSIRKGQKLYHALPVAWQYISGKFTMNEE